MTASRCCYYMGQKWPVKEEKKIKWGLVAFQEIKIMKTFFRLRLIPPQKQPILISGSVYFLDIATIFVFFKTGLFLCFHSHGILRVRLH